MPSKIRNRNKGKSRRVRAGDLVPHPANWRRHDAKQAETMLGVLEEVGFVGSLVAVERDGKLQLIDGHLRSSIAPELMVDVTVVDLTDDEVKLVLASHDAIGMLATADGVALDRLLADLDVASGALASMFSEVMGDLEVEKPTKEPRREIEDCEFPLAPVFNEKYSYVIIFSRNETEFGALQTILQLEREKSYKSTLVAVGRVIPATKFFQLWDNRDGASNHLSESQPLEDDSDASGD